MSHGFGPRTSTRDVSVRCRLARSRGLFRVTLSAAIAICATAAAAGDYPTRAVGPWVVSASSDQLGCFLTRTYAGNRDTTLQFGIDRDGSNRLTLLNTDWSITRKQRLALNFRLSNAAFPRHAAVGIAADGKKGFVTSFGADFPTHFAASRYLRVDLDGTPVADLDLNGSGAAVAELRRCVGRSRDPLGRRDGEGRTTTRVPVDPFAARADSPSGK